MAGARGQRPLHVFWDASRCLDRADHPLHRSHRCAAHEDTHLGVQVLVRRQLAVEKARLCRSFVDDATKHRWIEGAATACRRGGGHQPTVRRVPVRVTIVARLAEMALALALPARFWRERCPATDQRGRRGPSCDRAGHGWNRRSHPWRPRSSRMPSSACRVSPACPASARSGGEGGIDAARGATRNAVPRRAGRYPRFRTRNEWQRTRMRKRAPRKRPHGAGYSSGARLRRVPSRRWDPSIRKRIQHRSTTSRPG